MRASIHSPWETTPRYLQCTMRLFRNRIPIYIFKSISDFETAIAIMIAIKNQSGKIAI